MVSDLTGESSNMTNTEACMYPDCLIQVEGFGMACEHSCPIARLARELRKLASEPPEAIFTNVEDLLAWLDR